MDKKFNSRHLVKFVFTQEQLEEQEKFTNDLRFNNIDTVFEGTFLEGKMFLEETHKLVDRGLY